jgi:RNA polymerase primary sigma factor
MPKDLRIEFKVKNAILYRALQSFAQVHELGGWGEKQLNFAEISRYTGTAYNDLIGYLTLRLNPWGIVGARSKERKYRLRKQALVLQSSLDLPAEEIFPFDLYQANIPKDYAVEVDSFQMISLAEARRMKSLPPPEAYEMDDPKDFGMLYDALQSLTTREEEIIKMRYGLGESEKTLEEVAEKFGCGKERIRQIEKKALKKLRHPVRLAGLKG